MTISNSLKQAIENSQNLVRDFGLLKIDSEHLLYGILTVENSNGASLLRALGVSEKQLKKVIISYQNKSQNNPSEMPVYSKAVSNIFAKTDNFCLKNGLKTANIEEILFFMLSKRDLKATMFLQSIFKLDIENLISKLKKLIGENLDYSVSSQKTQTNKIKFNFDYELPDALKNLGFDLTKKVASSGMAKIIGRDEETSRMIEILCRKTKNNPVLVGEAGVGKSSVVEGLAQRIVSGDVPETISGKIIFSLDLASLMAGTKFRGSMEQKLKNAISAIQESGNIIVFIDEIHMLAEAGSKDGEISPSDILKPYLARGELHLIGATTLDEYSKYIEKDPALERRFQPVKVDEPSAEDTMKILRGIRSSFEKFHNVKILDDAIESAVNLSIRYITNRFLPDKAIDLIDEACSKARVNASTMPAEVKEKLEQISNLERQKLEFRDSQNYLKANEVNDQIFKLNNEIEVIKSNLLSKSGKSFGEIGSDEIRDVVSSWTNIPVKKLTSNEREKLLNLENIIGERVIGQNEAVSVVSKAIRRSRADINDQKRPIGSFLFLGPTGVGKTELTKAIADVLFDSEDSIIRFDMSEFMESHSISRLIGAPPGYVGHEDGGELTERVRKNPYSIVLFDEIEKAHSDIFNILLQVLDEGRLTDSAGKQVNFKNTVIILTSNNGVQELISRRKFEREHPEQKRIETQEFLMDKLRDKFKPELLNRIDSVVIFDSLSTESILKISSLMLDSLQKRFDKKNITLKISESARTLVCEKGYDEMFGARPLKRVIDKEIKDPLAEMIISNEIVSGSAVEVDAKNGKFVFNVLC